MSFFSEGMMGILARRVKKSFSTRTTKNARAVLFAAQSGLRGIPLFFHPVKIIYYSTWAKILSRCGPT